MLIWLPPWAACRAAGPACGCLIISTPTEDPETQAEEAARTSCHVLSPDVAPDGASQQCLIHKVCKLAGFAVAVRNALLLQ